MEKRFRQIVPGFPATFPTSLWFEIPKSTLNTGWLPYYPVSLFPATHPRLFLVQRDNQEGTRRSRHDQRLPDYGEPSWLFTTSASHFNSENKSIFDNNNFSSNWSSPFSQTLM
jgi:hypothetical protein